MSKKFNGPNYKSYVKAYKAKESVLNKKGLSMYDTMYTKAEFKAVYKATRNDLKEEVSKGKRKVVGNITQTMISEQSYKYSQRQGKAFAIYSEKTGQKLTQQQIRSGQIDFSIIDNVYKEYRKSGYTATESKKLISQNYFGSP